MKTRSVDYPEYKTARQWAKQGLLPIEGANGITLWATRNYQDQYVYYSPEEVAEATDEQLKEFFRPERELRNSKARARREQQKAERLAAIERERRQEQQNIINNAIKPYLKRISELNKLIEKNHSSTIVIDTETTGLDPEKDELLQVSIIDIDGNELFNSYFKPHAISWHEAEKVNHISPEMVQNAPAIADKIARINEIVYSAEKIIGYNTYFDLRFLISNGLIISEDAVIEDVMKRFAPIYGQWNEYFEDYKWQKLTTAASYYGYDWESRPYGAHNSLADCYATLYVHNKILEHDGISVP